MVAAKAAIKGPVKDDIAFTNCPTVRLEVNLSPFTTFVNSGFSDTCRMVLAIPNNAKASNDITKVYSINGINIATIVITLLKITVFLRPILFIIIPVGTEKIRNIENNATGIMLERVSLNSGLNPPNRSSLTCIDVIPTTSQKPMMKKPNNTGRILEIEFSFFIHSFIFKISYRIACLGLSGELAQDRPFGLNTCISDLFMLFYSYNP